MKNWIAGLLTRRWFANLVMMMILLGGLYWAQFIQQEMLPAREARRVEVSVQLPGASPDEINTSILVAVENAIRGLDGIKRVDSQALEGIGIVTIALLESADPTLMLGNIKKAVDRITTFPRDAEKPTVLLPSEKEKALSIIVYGDQPLLWLRQTAESVRDDLRTRAGLTRVELAFPRDREISVEVSEETLRKYRLSPEEIADKIRENALDLPGGTLFTPWADMVLRTSERRERTHEFEDMVITQSASGIPLRLADMAVVKSGFGDSPIECWFNNRPAIQLDVFSVGDETPISVEKAVMNYLDTFGRKKYQGVKMAVLENQAAAYRSRMELLIENALLGLMLVLAALGLFLTPHLAFWVMVGIPTSLLGGLLLMPLFNASMNMISMFAFIVTIGVVVDDAIMMGEAIHNHRLKGLGHCQATVQGLTEMGGPVLLATSTTIIAFMPMFFIPGEMGEIFRQIPAVIVAVLLVSLVESLFILPAHLAKESPKRQWMAWLARPQQVVNAKLKRFIQGVFRGFMQNCLNRPGIPIAAALSLLLVTFGGIAGGLVGFGFMPVIESDFVIARAALPYGSPKEQSMMVREKLVELAGRVLQEHGMKSPGILSLIGTRLEEGEVEVETLIGSHYVSVLTALPPSGERTLSGTDLARAWEKAFGNPDGLESLSFSGQTKISGGEPVRLEVFHPDPIVARAAALALGEELGNYSGFTSIDDGIRVGKPEWKITLKKQGLLMGLSAQEVARQVRHRFHGATALRFVREGNEIKVMVRLTEKERRQYNALDEVLLKNPTGALVPLTKVAHITQTNSFTSLARRDGKRIYPVTADTGFGIHEDLVENTLEEKILPEILEKFPGVSVNFGGEEEETEELSEALKNGFIMVLIAMYLLLAVYFNSPIQPLLVLSVIPFSLMGAVWGHIALGYHLSIVSIIGIIAMTGVVVNDSLVLVAAYNRNLSLGGDHINAIVDAACRRFRPILLTSATTFLGLAPLLLETSEQAQFLVGAAISISFGLAFGTVITLVMLPCLLCFCPKR